MLELASVCEEVANNIDDHLTADKTAARPRPRPAPSPAVTAQKR
jgi:hypothetical protein